MRQSVVAPTDAALKDSRSEPDCTKPLLPPPAIPSAAETQEPSPPRAAQAYSAARKHMLSRSQVREKKIIILK